MIEPAALVGANDRIELADVNQLAVERISVTKTAGKAKGAAVAMGYAILMVSYAGMALH